MDKQDLKLLFITGSTIGAYLLFSVGLNNSWNSLQNDKLVVTKITWRWIKSYALSCAATFSTVMMTHYSIKALELACK